VRQVPGKPSNQLSGGDRKDYRWWGLDCGRHDRSWAIQEWELIATLIRSDAAEQHGAAQVGCVSESVLFQ